MQTKAKSFLRLVVIAAFIAVPVMAVSYQATVNAASDSGSAGLTGTISAPPPSQGATIAIPTNGQSFTALPIKVSGLCPNGLLVKVFKNNVFAGAAQCQNGSYSITMDLFSGANDLVARVYDALDQAGPDSNIVSVSFNDSQKPVGTRISLTSNYAKRGANPTETLTWPLIISGGNGPYAVSVDWGDGKTPDLLSQAFPGTFNVKHVYDAAGVYNILAKATDKDGNTAFLQLVGIGNGPVGQSANGTTPAAPPAIIKTKILWQPAAILLPFLLSTFWLGKRYELNALKRRIRRGERPFA